MLSSVAAAAAAAAVVGTFWHRAAYMLLWLVANSRSSSGGSFSWISCCWYGFVWRAAVVAVAVAVVVVVVGVGVGVEVGALVYLAAGMIFELSSYFTTSATISRAACVWNAFRTWHLLLLRLILSTTPLTCTTDSTYATNLQRLPNCKRRGKTFVWRFQSYDLLLTTYSDLLPLTHTHTLSLSPPQTFL